MRLPALKFQSKDNFYFSFFFQFYLLIFLFFDVKWELLLQLRAITFHKNRNSNSKIVYMEKCWIIGQNIRNTSAWPIVRPSWITVSTVYSLHSTLMIHLDNIEAHFYHLQSYLIHLIHLISTVQYIRNIQYQSYFETSRALSGFNFWILAWY